MYEKARPRHRVTPRDFVTPKLVRPSAPKESMDVRQERATAVPACPPPLRALVTEHGVIGPNVHN